MTPEALTRLAFEFRAARALFSALELGLFDALGARARSAAELARDCRADERGVRILAQALVALGVLERNGEGYALSASLEPLLRADGCDSQAALWLHDAWHWPRWAQLARAVREGAAPPPDPADPYLSQPDVLCRLPDVFAGAMQQSAGAAPQRLARALAPLAPRRVLDLGGGTGESLIALLQALPAARGVLAERGFMLERARAVLARSGLEARVDLVELDFERQAPPEGCDLVLLSRVLMGLPPERARALVVRAVAQLPPGGALAVHDYESDSRVGALLSLDALLHTGGAVPSDEQVEDWFDAAGLRLQISRPLLPWTRLWIGRKPE